MEFQPDRAKPPSHPQSYLETTYACGLRRDHVVRVHRATWPPKSVHAHSLERPSLSGVCERCGANLIVYDPPPVDVTVILYGDAAAVQGRVEDEGQVLEETEPVTAGQVVEEPRSPKRR